MFNSLLARQMDILINIFSVVRCLEPTACMRFLEIGSEDMQRSIRCEQSSSICLSRKSRPQPAAVSEMVAVSCHGSLSPSSPAPSDNSEIARDLDTPLLFPACTFSASSGTLLLPVIPFAVVRNPKRLCGHWNGEFKTMFILFTRE